VIIGLYKHCAKSKISIFKATFPSTQVNVPHDVVVEHLLYYITFFSSLVGDPRVPTMGER
jgi:hypothetical protein